MVALRAVFILVIIQCNLVLPLKILQDSSDKHVKKKDGLLHRFKRANCPEGEYRGEKHCCKNCAVGFHLVSECTEPNGNPECNECIEGVDYMDKPSGYPHCQKCKPCESGSGQEVLRQCTISQDTVCKCKEGFDCSDSSPSPDGGCDQCRHHTESGGGAGPRTHLTVGIVVGSIAIIAAVIARYCWKRRQTGNTSTEIRASDTPLIIPDPPSKSIPDPKNMTCPPLLENVDLDNHLYTIASIMGQESVMKLVSKTLTSVDIEEIKANHLGNAREEKYELLKKWYTARGSQGAFKTLIENCTHGEAEKILDLVQA